MSDTPTPRARRTVLQRLLIAVNAVAVVGFLASAGALLYGYQKIAQIPRVQIGDVLTVDDDARAGDPENFLVVGVDSAEGLDPDDPVAAVRTQVGGLRSDTMMVLRIDPATDRASLLSLPRDLWVPVPGVGRQRLNIAVQVGGPELLVETIQEHLGLPIHHYVQVDFLGFRRLVEALDGVPVFFPHPARDLRSGLDVPEAGCVTLDAERALGFVRARAYQELVDGRWRTDPSGDFGRVQRQQAFIVAALEQATDQGLRNPVTLDELLDSLIGVVTIDDTLDTDDLLDLVNEFRAFDPAALEVHQLPAYIDSVGGASIVRLRSQEAEGVLRMFRGDDPEERTPASVRVRVLNGTGEPGQAAGVADELAEAGFARAGTGDAERLGVRRTEVRHPPGSEDEADLVARWSVARVRVILDEDVAETTVVTGSDWAGVRDEPRPPSSTTTTTTTSTTTTTTNSATDEVAGPADDPEPTGGEAEGEPVEGC